VTEPVDLDRFSSVRRDLARDHHSGKIVCVACAHRCKLAPGRRGVCQVRAREGAGLRVPWGYTAGAAIDPIEKKPFFHVLPGSSALSFGMLGCDMRCSFCQNWFTSQSLRDPTASTRVRPATAEGLVSSAVASGCRSVVSTYNEPLITAEWAHHVFTGARQSGLLTGLVSNGHATPEVLDYLLPVTDLFKIDLKAFRTRSYRSLGGRLEAVTDTIRSVAATSIWLEVVTLIVPGFNDDPGELADMAAWLASVSADIPWHVTAFHPDYRMTDRGGTPARALIEARRIGQEAGLRYVYSGNIPGAVRRAEDTVCPGCGEVLVERVGFSVVSAAIGADGRCPACGTAVPGVWDGGSGRPGG